MKHVPVGFTCDEEKQSWLFSSEKKMLDKYISKKQYPKESKEQDIGMGYILLSLFIYFKCPILRVIIFK